METERHYVRGNVVIREINKQKVLSYIRMHPSVSRLEMCKDIGISTSTATRVVEQLIQEGLVLEMPEETPLDGSKISRQVGRNPVKLKLNASAKYCFGINLSKHTLGIALVDFCLDIVAQYVTTITEIEDVAGLLERVGDVVHDMAASRKLPKQKILGLGVGTPGFVDSKTGAVRNFGINKFSSLPICQYLSNRFGLPVIVDNNANTRMLGEHWSGYAAHCKNAVFVVNSEGVGSGILYDGNILADTNHFSAGLGHISVDFDGEPCGCGSKGCVELYCGTEHLERKAFELTGEKLDYKELAKLAEQGDARILPLFETAAKAMSSGLTSLITLVCPEVIILSGTLFDASDYYYRRVIQLTLEKTGIILRKPVFKRRRVKDGIYEIGAAALFLKKYFYE